VAQVSRLRPVEPARTAERRDAGSHRTADAPHKEIDYVLAGSPPDSANFWDLSAGLHVLDEPLASDHRPLLGLLRWRPKARVARSTGTP
jgi:endonuclease/exonuclease/phosphatase (EEP) superfamily protein YafD